MSVLETSKKEIKARISDLKSEIKRLESALELIGGEVASSEKASAAKKKANIADNLKKSSAGRAPRGQRREQVLSVISENSGIKASQIARECDMLPSAVHPILKKLTASGSVVKADDKSYHLPSADKPTASSGT